MAVSTQHPLISVPVDDVPSKMDANNMLTGSNIIAWGDHVWGPHLPLFCIISFEGGLPTKASLNSAEAGKKRAIQY